MAKGCPHLVPGEVMERLRADFRHAATHSLLLTGQLLTILQHFGEAAIPAIAFKGPVLAATGYGDLALREYSDLDILVRGEDLARAKSVLYSLGFHCSFAREWETAHFRLGHEFDFLSADGRFAIDLQWRLASRWLSFPVDVDGVWRRHGAVPLWGGTTSGS
jgi:putative nucleotidyltransferase-like protein